MASQIRSIGDCEANKYINKAKIIVHVIRSDNGTVQQFANR